MPITTHVVSSNSAHGEVYSIQLYVIKFVSDLRQFSVFFSSTLVSSTSKTDRHDITEILLKVALNTVTLTISRKASYITLNKIVKCIIIQSMKCLRENDEN